MEKKLLTALILTVFAGTAIAYDEAAKADKSMSGAASDSSISSDASAQDKSISSDTSAQDKSMSGAASASGDRATLSNIDSNRLSELSADPQTTLFLRLDTDKDGILSNDEYTAGKSALTIDVSNANADSNTGVDLIEFKTAITNSMLGISGNTMAASNAGSAASGSSSGSSAAGANTTSGSDRNVQGADIDTNTQGMQSDKVMEQVVEEQGGPTTLRGGPNPSPDQATPEQNLNVPDSMENKSGANQ